MTARARRAFLGLAFDPLTLSDVTAELRSRSAKDSFAYLVTPNVDHVVRFHDKTAPDTAEIQNAYLQANWCVCDSRVLAALAARYGVRLPVATGSDITAALLTQVCEPGDRIAIIGGSEQIAEEVERRFPHLLIAHHAPPMGLRSSPSAIQAAAAFAAASDARFIFLAVGSPQQELIARAIMQRGNARGTALCIGASIEFVVGEQSRAPALIQQLHLEWAFRLLSDPKRLWRRYLITGPSIFLIARRFARTSVDGSAATDR